MTVRMGPDGRVLVPVRLRRQLQLHPGTPLVARAEGDRLVLERSDAAVRRLQSIFEAVPGDVSLVDELLADRRRDAGREDG